MVSHLIYANDLVLFFYDYSKSMTIVKMHLLTQRKQTSICLLSVLIVESWLARLPSGNIQDYNIKVRSMPEARSTNT